MKLVDALPRNHEDWIHLDPCGTYRGETFDCGVNPEWLRTNFPELAEAEVPLSDEKYNELKSIDHYWEENAERWRDEGII